MSDLSNIRRRYTKEQLNELIKEQADNTAALRGILDGFRANGHPLPEQEKLLEDTETLMDRAHRMLGKLD